MDIKFDTLRKLCILAEQYVRSDSNPKAEHDWFLDENGILTPDPLVSDPEATPLTLDEFVEKAYNTWNKYA